MFIDAYKTGSSQIFGCGFDFYCNCCEDAGKINFTNIFTKFGICVISWNGVWQVTVVHILVFNFLVAISYVPKTKLYFTGQSLNSIV